jgi:hypothetical protein
VNDRDFREAAAFAPLVSFARNDPPADPAIWLRSADLVEVDDTGRTTQVCAADAFSSWPTYVVTANVRPFDGEASGGFSFIPRSRVPKLISAVTQPLSDGRTWHGAGTSSAPCFFEVEQIPGGKRISYWFFFPTSTTPSSEFTALVPALIHALNRQQLQPEAFPPICVQIPRSRKSRFWDRVASTSEFARKNVEAMRIAGGVFSSPVVLLGQLVGADCAEIIEQLDPAEQERIASLYVHEGDWEGVSVEVDERGLLRRVLYWGHGLPLVSSADEVRFEHYDGQPRWQLRTAIGSHASAPAEEAARSGLSLRERLQSERFAEEEQVLWQTWVNLQPANEQPWYGFGGSWGRPRLAPFGTMSSRRFASFDLWKESTGPLGPSAFKLASNAAAIAKLTMN